MTRAARLSLAALIVSTAPPHAAAQAPLASPPAAARAERPPVEAFAELPFLSSPLLSPDGARIAARVTSGEQERIAIWRLSDPRDAEPQAVAAANVESFAWAGSDRLLVTSSYLAIHITGTAWMIGPARRVMIHELSSGKTIPIADDDAALQDIIHVDAAGRYLLASRLAGRDRYPGVDRIDLATGEAVRVQPPVRGVWSWFADNRGIVRVGIDYGERRTRIYYRAEPTGQLARLETRQELLQDSVVDLVRFVSDEGRGIMGTNAVTGRFALYEYDFAVPARGAALFEHDEVDVTAAVFAADGSLDGVVYEDDRPRAHWINPAMARVQARLDGTLAGKTNAIVNRSADGNRLLVFSFAADDPGTYYVFDQAAGRLEIFASPYARLQELSFAPVSPVSYRSRDGLAIRGYLTLPPGGARRGLPLVVLPHGGPFLRDSWTFNPEVQFLASRGYAVLQPNFRGSTGYGRGFVERGYGQLGAGMIDDIDDGVDWLVGEGVADPARVCIMGSSYGGYAAIWGAMRSPRRYRCAISWAGPTDLLAMMRRDARLLYAQRYVRERRRQLRGDEEVSLRAISPLRFPERLEVPLLIGHGEGDQRVPVDQSRDLVRALARRGAAVESAFYPKSGHDFGTSEDSADFLRRVEAFLARHNPPRFPVPAEAPAAARAGLSISPVSR